jgi:alpha-glucosidase (family GH31 glycosyl hydrolase)
VDLATIPVYARAGAIVPFGPVKQYTDQPVDAPVQITIYPGGDGLFRLYDDDGATYNFRRGAFTRIRCAWRDSRREFVLAIENAPPDRLRREFEIRIAPETNVRKIVLRREPVVVRF